MIQTYITTSPLWRRTFATCIPCNLLNSLTKLILCGTLIFLTACTTELTLGNSEPYIVSVGPLGVGEENSVNVFYTIADFQHDDADINVEVCSNTKGCAIAVSSPFGDGTQRITTVGSKPNTYSASHIFSWDVNCGYLDATTNTYKEIPETEEFWIQISVVTSETAPVKSKNYTLKSIGVTPNKTLCKR